MSGLSRVQLALFATYLLGCAATVFCAVIMPGHFNVAMMLTASVFFIFTINHAVERLGGRNATLFLVITLVGTLAFETAGVMTGLIYGSYYYTENLGWHLPGGVPVLIPFVWFIMLYASHAIAEILCGRGSPGRVAVVTAVAMTAWDLVIDPIMVARGGWVWREHGAYFGIPLVNFAGWFVTAFTITFLYGCFEARRRPNSSDTASDRLALASYGVTGLTSVLGGVVSGQPAPAFIALVCMGSLVLAARAAMFSSDTAPAVRLAAAAVDSLRLRKSNTASGLISI